MNLLTDTHKVVCADTSIAICAVERHRKEIALIDKRLDILVYRSLKVLNILAGIVYGPSWDTGSTGYDIRDEEGIGDIR